MVRETLLTSILKVEEVVISGLSGRFPESDNVDEFAQNLYNKVDMIVDDDRRWPKGPKTLSYIYI
jgi:acyl transferase domain-containing protein